jgi:hypothetical protein
MKDEVFFGEGMAKVKKEYPDLYKALQGNCRLERGHLHREGHRL